jgi:hypothetical protein
VEEILFAKPLMMEFDWLDLQFTTICEICDYSMHQPNLRPLLPKYPQREMGQVWNIIEGI